MLPNKVRYEQSFRSLVTPREHIRLHQCYEFPAVLSVEDGDVEEKKGIFRNYFVGACMFWMLFECLPPKCNAGFTVRTFQSPTSDHVIARSFYRAHPSKFPNAHLSDRPSSLHLFDHSSNQPPLPPSVRPGPSARPIVQRPARADLGLMRLL